MASSHWLYSSTTREKRKEDTGGEGAAKGSQDRHRSTRERLNKALQLTISKVVRLCLCLGSTHVGTLLMHRKGLKLIIILFLITVAISSCCNRFVSGTNEAAAALYTVVLHVDSYCE